MGPKLGFYQTYKFVLLESRLPQHMRPGAPSHAKSHPVRDDIPSHMRVILFFVCWKVHVVLHLASLYLLDTALVNKLVYCNWLLSSILKMFEMIIMNNDRESL